MPQSSHHQSLKYQKSSLIKTASAEDEDEVPVSEVNEQTATAVSEEVDAVSIYRMAGKYRVFP